MDKEKYIRNEKEGKGRRVRSCSRLRLCLIVNCSLHLLFLFPLHPGTNIMKLWFRDRGESKINKKWGEERTERRNTSIKELASWRVCPEGPNSCRTNLLLKVESPRNFCALHRINPSRFLWDDASFEEFSFQPIPWNSSEDFIVDEGISNASTMQRFLEKKKKWQRKNCDRMRSQNKNKISRTSLGRKLF